jgi:hypothetical protein
LNIEEKDDWESLDDHQRSPQGEGDDWESLDDWQDAPARGPQPLPDRPGEAFLQGFGQAGTFGYLPHINAGVETGVDKVMGLVNKDWPQSTYLENRDRNIKEDAQLYESNPGSYIGGAAAETILELPAAASKAGKFLPGGRSLMGSKTAANALSKAALKTTGSKGVARAIKGPVARGILGATEQGLLYNPGDEEGKIDPIQWDKRMDQAQDFAGTAGLVAAGGKAIKGVANLPKKMRRAGESVARRAVGYQGNKTAVKRIDRKEKEIADTIFNEDILPIGGNAQIAADRSGQALDNSYSKLKKAYGMVDEARDKVRSAGEIRIDPNVEGQKQIKVTKKDVRGFHPKKQAPELEARIREELGAHPDKEAATARVMDWVDTQAKATGKKSLPASEARKLKTEAGKQAGYGGATPKKDAKSRAFRIAERFIVDEQAKGAEKVGAKGASETIKKENRRSHLLKEINTTAKDKAAAIKSNIPGGSLSALAGIVAGSGSGYAGYKADPDNWGDDVVGNILFGLGTYGLVSGGRRLAPSVLAHGLKGTGELLKRPANWTSKKLDRHGVGLIRSGTKLKRTLEK